MSSFTKNNQKPSKQKSQASFFEAFTSIGKNSKDSSLKATPKKISRTIGRSVFSEQKPIFQSNKEASEASQSKKDSLKLSRHNEIINMPIYDRHQEEIKRQLQEIRDELKLLIQEISSAASSTINAIEEEVVNPGTYHISFFEALKRYIMLLRKKASEAGNWLDLSQSRKNAKSGNYWGKVKKHGTKFLQSNERSIATKSS